MGLGVSIAGAQQISRREPARYAAGDAIVAPLGGAGVFPHGDQYSFGEWTMPAANRGTASPQ